ncbi:carbohydrate sulfotransferase 3a [Callorhinchus milii]|uniref:Sulfotransferase n=1 Tax=Callorhinchus milii TaxID=7868 RepID=A0A4W3ILM0_CALMI|nr:carbohydrate sulfotransferase 3a [Callorhinchus milii]|eukprot:gi/632937187/ref/XP_007897582.1/ PREDICTED: carbohydrate sulfotransferase 3 [Callorhinchus milii]
MLTKWCCSGTEVHNGQSLPNHQGTAAPVQTAGNKPRFREMTMRIKYAIVLVFLATLVIIEKENKIISRVSDSFALKLPKLDFTMNFSVPASAKFAATPSRFWELEAAVGQQDDNNNNNNRSSTAGPVARSQLLLMATTRTGSSFSGEFFNQNPGVFYLFEPLWHVGSAVAFESDRAGGAASGLLNRDVLRQLLLCDLSVLEAFIAPAPHGHVTRHFFRRFSSRLLCEPPVCSPPAGAADSPGDTAKTDRYHCKNHCGPLNLTLAAQACLGQRHMAVKTVRMRQLELLRPLVEDPRLDLRVIQLVRDPRAVLASRMVAFSSRYVAWQRWGRQDSADPPGAEEAAKVRESCESLRASAELGLSQPDWLRGRYLLVRYEDITREPLRKAAEMHRFAGITLAREVEAWIRENTQGPQPGTQKGSVYSTRRNSSEQSDKWRLLLPFKLAQAVQGACGPAMQLFGYRPVRDAAALANLSASLLEPAPF